MKICIELGEREGFLHSSSSRVCVVYNRGKWSLELVVTNKPVVVKRGKPILTWLGVDFNFDGFRV
jgi:hypothetical protein